VVAEGVEVVAVWVLVEVVAVWVLVEVVVADLVEVVVADLVEVGTEVGVIVVGEAEGWVVGGVGAILTTGITLRL